MMTLLRALTLLLLAFGLAPDSEATSYCEGEEASISDLLASEMEVVIMLGAPIGPEVPPFDANAPRPIAQVVGTDDLSLMVTDPESGMSMLFPLVEVGDCIVRIGYPLARQILSRNGVEMPPPGIGAAFAACTDDESASVPTGFNGVYMDIIRDGEGAMLRIASEVPATYPGAEHAHQVISVCSPHTSTPTWGVVFAFQPSVGSE